MGNCQAIDAAVLVLQHPSGKIDRLYWPVAASEVMRTNPGHYVSLIIPLPESDEDGQIQDGRTVRYSRVKLLRPSDTLTLGHAYRLITSQEVMKVMRAKKYAKGKSQNSESVERLCKEPENQNSRCESGTRPNIEKNLQATRQLDRNPHRTVSAKSAIMRSKSWRPSLQSISELGYIK